MEMANQFYFYFTFQKDFKIEKKAASPGRPLVAWINDSQICLMDRIYLENFMKIVSRAASINNQNRVERDLYFLKFSKENLMTSHCENLQFKNSFSFFFFGNKDCRIRKIPRTHFVLSLLFLFFFETKFHSCCPGWSA